jgi:TolB protein
MTAWRTRVAKTILLPVLALMVGAAARTGVSSQPPQWTALRLTASHSNPVERGGHQAALVTLGHARPHSGPRARSAPNRQWEPAEGSALADLESVQDLEGRALGWFQDHADVGKPAIAGSTLYDAEKQTYTITGAGTNMWGNRDEFQFAWRKLTGDFILRAHVAFTDAGVEPHRKLGWIIRSSLEPDSAYADVAAHGDGLTSLQFRRTAGAVTEQVQSPVTSPQVVQLERHGKTYTMSVARFGDPFTRTDGPELELGDEVFVGLFVCSHNPHVKEQAVFSNVRIVVPPREGWTPYRDYIGSNLEVLSIDTGARKVVHTSPVSLQAPNWTSDGKALIYNSGGRLYRFDLATRLASPIDTGFATSNNNDHVLSFDGRILGISHHSKEDGNRSVVYTVPVAGGVPTRVTAKSPSYLHGWSPDARHLIYTGGRNGEFDIYKISVDGGDEVALTTTPGLDDGSEYTPDGRWIYFNSARTGRMQIWRMRPDGSEPQQITNDEFHNWFPHISPDGRWMVVLSYGQDVAAEDHPFYRQVYLRLMRPDGTSPKVVAYVYGGQGTINVPSWSPDSTQIAFVSNTALTYPR